MKENKIATNKSDQRRWSIKRGFLVKSKEVAKEKLVNSCLS